MRHRHVLAWAALALLMAAAPAFASNPVPIVMGPSRDGSLQELQKKVDHLVGPWHVDVQKDYIGAHAGDPDPWTWANNGAHVISIKLIDRKSPHGVVGWYKETGDVPGIDGVDDAVVFDNRRLRGSQSTLRLPASVKAFGFFIEHEGGDDGEDEGQSYRYFTNRALNDVGPHGRGALHTPWTGGDPQLLVYDVSRWIGPDTWLVACEYSDSGCNVGMGSTDSDNDYSDILFLVTGAGAGSVTPTRTSTFSHVKAMYR
jgi:hypothetical protein